MRLGVNTLFMIPGEVGGTETYLRHTLRAIAAHHPDVQLVLFCNEENEPVLREDLASRADSEFFQLGFQSMNRYVRIFREQTQLPRVVRKAGVDVLWSPGYTAPFSAPCPQAVTVHDMQYKQHPEDLGSLALLVTDVLVRMACRRCAGVIAVSEFSKSEIVKHTAACADHVHVTLEGVDPIFAVPREEARPAWLREMADDAHPYLLGVANSYPHKNLHILVEAFAGIASTVPHRLLLVGKPRLGEPALQDAIAASGCHDRIVRVSGLPWDQIVSVYKHADLFVFPSLYEGFGLPVLEAMLAGVPVVTTRHASIPEVAGSHAFFVDPVTAGALADRLLEVLRLPDERRRACTRKAYAWAAGFTWQRTADQTLAALRAIRGH